jgi:3-oxoacyl-[acyl-carrier-protein] synthase III
MAAICTINEFGQVSVNVVDERERSNGDNQQILCDGCGAKIVNENSLSIFLKK